MFYHQVSVNEFVWNWLMFLLLDVAFFSLFFKIYFQQTTSCLPTYSVSNIFHITCLFGFFLGHPITKVFCLDILPSWTLPLSIITNWMLPSRLCILLCNIKFYCILVNFTLRLSYLFCPEVTKLNTTTSVPFLPFYSWKIIPVTFQEESSAPNYLPKLCL